MADLILRLVNGNTLICTEGVTELFGGMIVIVDANDNVINFLEAYEFKENPEAFIESLFVSAGAVEGKAG